MTVIALGRCAVCFVSFAFNPDRVPSMDIDARMEAIRIVDERHGYTAEFAPDAEQHAREYDEEEQRQFDPVRRQPICSTCVSLVNDERAQSGLPLIEIFHDSYTAADA